MLPKPFCPQRVMAGQTPLPGIPMQLLAVSFENKKLRVVLHAAGTLSVAAALPRSESLRRVPMAEKAAAARFGRQMAAKHRTLQRRVARSDKRYPKREAQSSVQAGVRQ